MGAAELGLQARHLHSLDDHLTCPLGRDGTLWTEAFAQTLQVTNGGRREPYFWHAGAGNPLSVPQLESQASTSSAVTWSPVVRTASQALSVS